ncbi:MAG: DNA-formamidopyrimidine glycosylase family protein [Gordonia amarae]
MPEGDTVYRTATDLRRALEGKVLQHSQFRTPGLATSDLTGRTVTSVRSRGKHLLIDIAATTTQSAVSIHTHLKMEGEWHVHPAGTRWRKPAHKARIVLRTSTHEAVGFELGVVELLADPDAALDYLGPDLLGDDWDPAEATARIAAHPDTTIGEALLDQRLMAGVGNEYRSEICFLRGIHPETPVADVDVAAAVDLARRLLCANKDRKVRVTTGNTAPHARLWVYGRHRQPCRRCRTPIVRETLGPPGQERSIYFCPACQS